MPMRSHSGITGDPWAYADCCGFQYRLSQLTMQNGALRCQRHLDNPERELRPFRVAEFMSVVEPDAPNETAKKRQNPNNVTEGF